MDGPDFRISSNIGVAGLRQVTIFFSDMVGFSTLMETLGDRVGRDLFNQVMAIQTSIIEKESSGAIQQVVGDEVFAIFKSPSVAMTRALEIQRALYEFNQSRDESEQLQVRMGLSIGEVFIEVHDRIELTSRHVNRTHRIMEAAESNQILTSTEVITMGRDHIEAVPGEFLGITRYGEYYLKGSGSTDISEITDVRLKSLSLPDTLSRDPERSVIGRLKEAGYESPERIGEGYFGVVYKASRKTDGQSIAVKVLNPIWAEDPERRQLFEAEATRLKGLEIPGIVQILDSHVDRSPPSFEMEWIDGAPLHQALQDSDEQQISECFLAICGILKIAHESGLVHGDLKPSNVLVKQDNAPVLLDFGLATSLSEDDGVSSSNSIVGTPGYIAPETISEQSRTPLSDIYALGVMLYRVLAGHEPFENLTVFDTLQSHLHREPPLPSTVNANCSQNLERICLKAMEKSPGDRYQGVEDLAADLRQAARGEVVLTRPTAYDNLLYHPARQHLEEVRSWGQEGLLSTEEEGRLSAAYDRLVRRGISAVMEAKQLELWQLLAYIGGWAVVNGTAVWLILHWSDIEPQSFRIALGSFPALSMFAIAWWFWKTQRFRLAFAAMITLILAAPVMTFVWIYEFEIGFGEPIVWHIDGTDVVDPRDTNFSDMGHIMLGPMEQKEIALPRLWHELHRLLRLQNKALKHAQSTSSTPAEPNWDEFETAIRSSNDLLKWKLSEKKPGSFVRLEGVPNYKAVPYVFLTNLQLLMIALSMLLVSALVTLITKTRTHNGQLVAAFFIFFVALLIYIEGINELIALAEPHPIRLAVRFVPVVLIALALSSWFIRRSDTESPLAIAWVHLGTITLVPITFVFCLDWLAWLNDADLKSRWLRRGLLMTAFGGAFLTWVGIAGRQYFRQYGRLATFSLVFIGLVTIPSMLFFVGAMFPKWTALTIWTAMIPLPHLLLPIVGIMILITTYRTHMYVFLVVGLTTFSSSMFYLGFKYFSHTQTWPILIVSIGIILFFVAVSLEFTKSRKVSVDPISHRRL